MAFPTSPTNGQQANINGITYTYSSALTAWTVSTSVSNSFVSISVSGNVNSGNVLATGLASVTGNVTGAYFIGNGSQLTGVVSSYGNANVVANLAALGSNPISSTGNVTGGNILTGGLISAASTITGTIITGSTLSSTGNINTVGIAGTGAFSTTGNITGGNLSGTSIVGTLTTAAQTNITAVGTLGSLTVTANTTSGNLLTGGLISATGNITGGNLLTGGLISAAGNISANNATFTSNQTLSYGTANGVAYLNGSKVLTTGSALVFDGTNLGVGTSSPANKLDVLGSSSDQIRVRTAGTEFYRFGRNASTGYMDFYGSQTGYQGYTFGGIDGTWLTLSSAGNLGLGVTPSAWSIRALQVGSGYAAWSSGVTNARTFANTYYDGSYKYMGTGRATQYEQDGYHAWYTAASGTAGNPISFTQAMTLDSGANLSVVGDVIGYASSDKKFKTNIRPIPNALSAVEHIGGKLFDWTDEYMESVGDADGYFRQKEDFGIVAQDVQKVFPLAVRTRPNGSLAVDYVKLSALAFASIAELSAKLKDLEGKINDLTSRT